MRSLSDRLSATLPTPRPEAAATTVNTHNNDTSNDSNTTKKETLHLTWARSAQYMYFFQSDR